ncbi:unnamed protein product [Symbiodinium sp. CCMP2592]|nr:unnamed protein product [Symbiodinium sp. CCMP2592]
MPTTFFRLEAHVKDPMMALELKLISMNSRGGQGFTALSTFANFQDTVSISVFNAILTVHEEIITSVSDNIDDCPWKFYTFDSTNHRKVESMLQKNSLKPLSLPVWFRACEPAVLLAFWARGGCCSSFALQRQCFKEKPPASWPVDLRESITPDRIVSVKATVVLTESHKTPQIEMTKQFQKCEIQKSLWVVESKLEMIQIDQEHKAKKLKKTMVAEESETCLDSLMAAEGAQVCFAEQEDALELFGGFGSFPDVGSRSNPGFLQISESETASVPAANDDLADFVAAPQAGQHWNPGKDVGRHIQRGFNEQAQILVVNLMLNLAKLSPQVLKSINESLPPVSPVRPLSARVAGQLLGVSGNSLKGVLHRVKNNGWVPHKPSVDGSSAGAVVGDCRVNGDGRVNGDRRVNAPAAETAKTQRDARSSLTSLVREAVSTVGNARPDGDFLEAITRLQKHGVDVGDKYCSQKFLQMHDGNGKC